jgi:hypothetical protein
MASTGFTRGYFQRAPPGRAPAVRQTLAGGSQWPHGFPGPQKQGTGAPSAWTGFLTGTGANNYLESTKTGMQNGGVG